MCSWEGQLVRRLIHALASPGPPCCKSSLLIHVYANKVWLLCPQIHPLVQSDLPPLPRPVPPSRCSHCSFLHPLLVFSAGSGGHRAAHRNRAPGCCADQIFNFFYGQAASSLVRTHSPSVTRINPGRIPVRCPHSCALAPRRPHREVTPASPQATLAHSRGESRPPPRLDPMCPAEPCRARGRVASAQVAAAMQRRHPPSTSISPRLPDGCRLLPRFTFTSLKFMTEPFRR